MERRSSLFGTPREWAKDLSIATAIGAFLGIIGPFGSFYVGPLGVRLPFWIANMWIGFAVVSCVVRAARCAADRLEVPVWFALAAGTALGSAPLGYVLAGFDALFSAKGHWQVRPFFEWYGQTLVIAAPCVFGYFYFDGRGKFSRPEPGGPAPRHPSPEAETLGDPKPSPVQAAPRFLDRLPARLGRELLCLQMEDHYVRAHTRMGSDLVLTPLKQAIAELDEAGGLQVHRSWWVRREAVVRSFIIGRRLFLLLVNGLEVPVSRAAVPRLRAAGWLDDPAEEVSLETGKIDAPA